MWTLKYDTNKLTNETEVDPQTENKLLGAKGEGGEGGTGPEFGISRYKRLFTN